MIVLAKIVIAKNSACPLNVKWINKAVIYKTVIEYNVKINFDFRSTANLWKTRIYHHKLTIPISYIQIPRHSLKVSGKYRNITILI